MMGKSRVESRESRAHRGTVTLLAIARPFPLTPTLSLREREQRPPRVRQLEASGLLARRGAVLPLPKGEGRGEGEQTARPSSSHDRRNHFWECQSAPGFRPLPS
jgi:hypothetical protein